MASGIDSRYDNDCRDSPDHIDHEWFGKKIKSKGVEVYAGKKSRIGPVNIPGVPFFTRAFAYHIRYVI
jgi:hypothetical protein